MQKKSRSSPSTGGSLSWVFQTFAQYFLGLLFLADLSDKIPQGLLKGFDQKVNIILSDTEERVFSKTDGTEVVPLGLYIVRGENVWVTCSGSHTVWFP